MGNSLDAPNYTELFQAVSCRRYCLPSSKPFGYHRILIDLPFCCNSRRLSGSCCKRPIPGLAPCTHVKSVAHELPCELRASSSNRQRNVFIIIVIITIYIIYINILYIRNNHEGQYVHSSKHKTLGLLVNDAPLMFEVNIFACSGHRSKTNA